MSKKRRYFLPFELDLFRNCGPIGMSCGLPVEQVSHGLLLLWEYVWRTKNDRVTTGHLKGFFFGGEPCEALLTFGVLEASESGWRVKGAAEWLRVVNAQSESGKAHSGNLRRGSDSPPAPPPASAPKRPEAGDKPSGSPPALPATSHQPPATSFKEEEEATSSSKPTPGPPLPTLPIDKFADGHAFWAFFQHKRHEVGLVPEKLPRAPLSFWWSEVGLELNGDYGRLEAAVYRFAEHKHWQEATPPVPFNAFKDQWRNFVPQKRSA